MKKALFLFSFALLAALAVHSASAVADTTPPSVPTGLTATPVSVSQINLDWASSTDNVGVAGYNVYRNGGVTPIATTTAAAYSDTGLTASTTYIYAVSAFDAAGNTSATTSPVSATTLTVPDTTPPSVPTGLTATAASSSQINLSWTASTDNVRVDGYYVYRNGGVTPIATTSATAYADTGLTASTTYGYVVAAFDPSGNVSATTSPASATTLAGAQPPAGAIMVNLKIRGGEEGKLINLRSNAKIKVVVFSTDSFDARTIDPKTVTFGGAKAVGWRLVDEDHNGKRDRIFDFRTRAMADLRASATQAVLKGKTKSGQDVWGVTTVRVKDVNKEKELERQREEQKKREEALREYNKKLEEQKREQRKHEEEVKREAEKQEQKLKREFKKQEKENRQNKNRKED